MTQLFSLDMDTYIKIIELAQSHGKKVGDNMQEEFDEIKKQYSEKIADLGTTEYDKDLLIGNLRENGIKILSLEEIERRRNNGEQ